MGWFIDQCNGAIPDFAETSIRDRLIFASKNKLQRRDTVNCAKVLENPRLFRPFLLCVDHVATLAKSVGFGDHDAVLEGQHVLAVPAILASAYVVSVAGDLVVVLDEAVLVDGHVEAHQLHTRDGLGTHRSELPLLG